MVTTIRKVTGGDYPFYEFACLSIDSKPTSLVPENSICHEIDTGKHFYFSNGEWKELPPKGGSGGGGLPDNFPAEGSENANKFLGFDANGDYTAKDASGGGGAEKFVVTLTRENDTWAADKTIAEIIEAYEDGQIVEAMFNDEIGISVVLSVVGEQSNEHQSSVLFSALLSLEAASYYSAFGFSDGSNDQWIVTVENIGIPSYSSSNNDQVLGVSSGSLAWVDNNAPLIVTLTEENGTWTADKTVAEIVAADVANKVVVCKLEFEETPIVIKIPMNGTTDGVVIFGGALKDLTDPTDPNANSVYTVFGSEDPEGRADWSVVTTPIPTSTNAPLIVTMTYDSSTSNLVGDKTYKEIYDAFSSGQAVFCKGVVGSTNVSASVLAASETSGEYTLNVCLSGRIVVPEGNATDYVTINIGS